MDDQFNTQGQQYGSIDGADSGVTTHGGGVQPGTWHDGQGQPAFEARGPEDEESGGDTGDTGGGESGGAASQNQHDATSVVAGGF